MVLNLNSPHTMTFICMYMNWSAIIIFIEFKDYTQVHGMERHSVILFRTNSFLELTPSSYHPKLECWASRL